MTMMDEWLENAKKQAAEEAFRMGTEIGKLRFDLADADTGITAMHREIARLNGIIGDLSEDLKESEESILLNQQRTLASLNQPVEIVA